jgi:hypothetical protein
VTVSWNANHEKWVNQSGGGYRLYYARSPGVDTINGTSVDVPYTSGLNTPTWTILQNLSEGTYYFRIVAYSHFPYGGGSYRSEDSSEISLTVP